MIILLNPPTTTFRRPEEHTGLGYLAAVLRAKGFDVEIIDAYAMQLSTRETINRILDIPDCYLLGISPFVDSLESTIAIVSEINRARSGIHITLGGHLSSFSYAELLQKYKGIDSIVIGEGEDTLLELASRMYSRERWKSIAGLAYRDDGELKRGKRRPLVPGLDLLPFPSRDTIQTIIKHRIPIHISSSRGCYGQCVFCSISSFYRLSPGSGWRGRSSLNVVREIEEIMDTYGAMVFKFVDDSFVGRGSPGKQRALQIAKMMVERKLNIRFRISCRTDEVEEELFDWLRRAGLVCVSLGVESGCDSVLKRYRKGTTIEQNKKAIQILEKLGIRVLTNLILFDPYTKVEEIRRSLEFIEETEHCLMHRINHPLYVHAADPITAILLGDGRIVRRDFPNYVYEIEDKRSRIAYRALTRWCRANNSLYYNVVEDLMAPRVLDPETEELIYGLYMQLKKIEINTFQEVVRAIDSGMIHLEPLVDELIENAQPAWRDIDKEISQIHAHIGG